MNEKHSCKWYAHCISNLVALHDLAQVTPPPFTEEETDSDYFSEIPQIQGSSELGTRLLLPKQLFSFLDRLLPPLEQITPIS